MDDFSKEKIKSKIQESRNLLDERLKQVIALQSYIKGLEDALSTIEEPEVK